MSTKIFVKLFFLFFFFVISVGGCIGPTSRYSNEYLPEVAKGEKEIFNSNGVCYVCHGVDADIQTISSSLRSKLNPTPTNLRDAHALKYKSDEEMRHVFTKGISDTSMVPMGPPDGKLTSEEVELLIIYLKKIRGR